MTGRPPNGITRRHVLGAGAIIAAGTLVTSLPTAASAQPTAALPPLDLDAYSTLTFFSNEYARQNTWLLANFVDISKARRATELTITFDNRIFVLSSALIIQAAGTLLTVGASSTTATGAATTVTYKIGDVVRRQTDLRILTPLSAVPLYPADNIEDAIAPSVSLRGRSAREATSASLVTSSVIDGVQPWVVVSSPSWHAVSTSSDASVSYRAPVVLRVVSGGPGAIPAGLTLRIETDAALCGDPVVAACTDAKGVAQPEGSVRILSTTDGLMRASRLVFGDELAAGEERQVSLAWPPKVLAAGAAGGVTSRVAVESRGSTTRPRRSRAGEDLQVDAWTGAATDAADVTKELG